MDTPPPTSETDTTLPPVPENEPAQEPSWWRLGWVPFVVFVLAAAAADFLFPRFHGFGVGASIGVLLGMGALLLLRRDFSRGEVIFLAVLTLVSACGLLINGSILCWLAALAVPFLLVQLPGKASAPATTKYLNWWQFWFSHRIRAEVCSRAGRIKHLLPLLLSILIGIVCFIFFLCIFASGNPVVELVWNAIADAWNSVVKFLNLNWEFCFHALCWVIGVLWFGLYTLKRPESHPVFAPAPVENKHSILPYLAPSVLIGTNLAFLIATSTDIAFLWLHRVPEGISQTDYLYDGVASISWASAIAAVLLMVLFRRNGSSRRSPLSRFAGYVLLIQTFVLAASVYMRLYYQVEAHGFTGRRVLAAETILLGIAGLVFLFIYMSRRDQLWSLMRPIAGVLMLLALAFPICPPTQIAGDLNMRYAADCPHWTFTAKDFNHRAFSVNQNLAFAWYVYQQCPDEDLRYKIESRCQKIIRRAEKRSWRSFSLFTSRDEALATEILQKLRA
ncbi:MAG: DUF4173 domain-containing protein [Akkermansia sp.]|nr:DUF4173 domain-containing protein [Akkermansia sp.]